jgi:hypothetical protein
MAQMPVPDESPGTLATRLAADRLQQRPQVDASAIEQLRSDGVAPWLLDRVAQLAKSDGEAVDAVLVEVGRCITIGDTKACCRCHFVRVDPHGRPRVDALIQQLLNQVVDYCIPRTQVAEALLACREKRSTAPLVALDREARALFAKMKKSGEGGEMLLYLLLENVLGLPQLMCKMFLKTSTEMHVHGADGIHGKLLENGRLALYWGESKLHADVTSAIESSLKSIAPYLLDSGGGIAERDLLLTRANLDPGDPAVREALVKYFDVTKPEAARVEYRGACLVGFDYDDYPDPLGEDGLTVRDEVAERVARWNAQIGTRVAKQELAAFDLEIFCVPMPSVHDFRMRLLDGLGVT